MQHEPRVGDVNDQQARASLNPVRAVPVRRRAFEFVQAPCSAREPRMTDVALERLCVQSNATIDCVVTVSREGKWVDVSTWNSWSGRPRSRGGWVCRDPASFMTGDADMQTSPSPLRLSPESDSGSGAT